MNIFLKYIVAPVVILLAFVFTGVVAVCRLVTETIGRFWNYLVKNDMIREVVLGIPAFFAVMDLMWAWVLFILKWYGHELPQDQLVWLSAGNIITVMVTLVGCCFLGWVGDIQQEKLEKEGPFGRDLSAYF